MKKTDRTLFFKALLSQEPRLETELFYTNAYTLLVAVVLSAQATDAGVNKATASLFKRVSSPQEMVALGEEGLRQAIRTIGLYPTKARHVIALSRLLLEKHQGAVPSDREALEALPGVGRKTANVVLNVFFNQPTIPVDTHVFRVANRTGLAPGKTPLEVEKKLLQCVPKAFLSRAYHMLIFHGRYTCKARKPLCAQCPVSTFCAYFKREKPKEKLA
ncbi:MAG: endonuclease III [Holosporaceae bacterium]